MQIDNTRCRDAMKRYEQHCIRTVRMTPLGEHLLNTNKALDEHRPRANYQKEWRRRENERRAGLGLPSWNAEMSARYRERRRLRLQTMRNEIAQEAHAQTGHFIEFRANRTLYRFTQNSDTLLGFARTP